MIVDEKKLRRLVRSTAGRTLIVTAADAYFEAVAELTRLEMRLERRRTKTERLETRLPQLRANVKKLGDELQYAAIGVAPENVA